MDEDKSDTMLLDWLDKQEPEVWEALARRFKYARQYQSSYVGRSVSRAIIMEEAIDRKVSQHILDGSE